MSKFKVGDRVRCVAEEGGFTCKIGEVYIVTELEDCWFHTKETGGGGFDDELFELAWQPKPGEMIEVWDDDIENACSFEFRGMLDGHYIVRTNVDCLVGYSKARPTKTTVTIIKESTGEKVEISQESSTSIFG